MVNPWFTPDDMVEMYDSYTYETVAYFRFRDIELFAPYATRVRRAWWIRVVRA